MPNFTTDDLLRYLYNELTPVEKEALKHALQSDWALREKLQVLTACKRRIDHMTICSPRKETIAQVLQYASELSVPSAN